MNPEHPLHKRMPWPVSGYQQVKAYRVNNFIYGKGYRKNDLLETSQKNKLKPKYGHSWEG